MNKNNIKSILKNNYGIDCADVTPGPRGFVGKTYIATDLSGRKNFVKYVDKPNFICKIKESVKIQNALYAGGFKHMNHIIESKENDLFTALGEAIVLVYNYINAKQSYKYNMVALGELEAELHTQSISNVGNIDGDIFQPEEALAYPSMIEKVLSSTSKDPIDVALKEIFTKRKNELDLDYKQFLALLEKSRYVKVNKVITHGDIGGNTLVKSPSDLYIIDWDEILFAPAERDLWTFWRFAKFREGYLRKLPSFGINKTLYHYNILMMYFTYTVHYLVEILGNRSVRYRNAKLRKMERDMMPGWTLPYLEIVRADY